MFSHEMNFAKTIPVFLTDPEDEDEDVVADEWDDDDYYDEDYEDDDYDDDED